MDDFSSQRAFMMAIGAMKQMPNNAAASAAAAAASAEAAQESADAVDVATMQEFLAYLDTQGSAQPVDEVTVSGANPVITAQKNTMYVCGEVQTISFTPNAQGLCAVQFASGTTAAILTVPNTVRWPAWFDPSALEANATYELSIRHGTLGAVMVWQ